MEVLGQARTNECMVIGGITFVDQIVEIPCTR